MYSPHIISLLWTVILFRTMSATVHQPDSMITAQLGESVTLKCFFSSYSRESMSWYKQRPGENPVLMVIVKGGLGPEFQEEFDKSSYNIEKDDRVFHLTIKKTTSLDEAYYFCAMSEYVKSVFGNGTFLLLRDQRQRRLDLAVQIKTSVSDPGNHASGPTTLDCTVLTEMRTKELSMFWFRPTSGNSSPLSIYMEKNCSSAAESKPHTQSCVYRLPVEHSSDSGTFYCAVASYGQLLFGNGVTLDDKDREAVDPLLVSLIAALIICVAVIIILVSLSCRRTLCEHCKALSSTGHAPPRPEVAGQGGEEVNYAALQFTEGRSRGGRKKRGTPQESVYSDIKSSRVRGLGNVHGDPQLSSS